MPLTGWIVLIIMAGVLPVAWLVIRHRKKKMEAVGSEIPSLNIEDEIEPEPPPPAIDRLKTQLSFRNRYREMAMKISIPNGARYVDKVIDIFSLRQARVTHFCWKAGEALHTFPVWESVESLLAQRDQWLWDYTPGDENNLSKLTLPIAKILSFTVSEETGEVTLRHLNFTGSETITIFCGGDSAKTFEKLIPEKRISFVRRRLYLSSAQNISDIKTEIGTVRDQFIRGLISKEEYERLKIACVLRM